MTEAGGGFDLAEKPLPPEGGGELRRQHLDRHRATVLQVLSEVDRRHPATAEFALDRVATGDGGLQAGDRVGHHEILLAGRSEEHTSELQSLAYLVCRLLLEKK